MAPIPLKFVVSFSSQDDRHPVQNLISGDGFKRWLSGVGDKSGQIEAVFQLDKSCVITHIDVGSFWCANIEVQVGKSSWHQGIPFKTLVAAANLMTPIDCRNGKNLTKTRMFNTADFMEDTIAQEWDRFRVICRQPFRKDVQFGLSFIRVKSVTPTCSSNNNNNNQSPSSSDKTDWKVKGLSGSPSPRTPTSSSKHSDSDSVTRTPSHLRKHFFQGGLRNSSPRTSELKNRLLKIASTAEDGTPRHEALSRTAKLVLAAADQIPKFQPTVPTTTQPKSQLLSNSMETRMEPSFEVEIRKFLACLRLTSEDLESTTIADLRHRLERRKRRKLTKEEKKLFIEITKTFLCSHFDEKTDNENRKDKNDKKVVNHSTPKQSCDNQQDGLPESLSARGNMTPDANGRKIAKNLNNNTPVQSSDTPELSLNSPRRKLIDIGIRTPMASQPPSTKSSVSGSPAWLGLSPMDDLPDLWEPAEALSSDILKKTADESLCPTPSKTPKYIQNGPGGVSCFLSTLEHERLLYLGTRNGSPTEKISPSPVGKLPSPIRVELDSKPGFSMKGKAASSCSSPRTIQPVKKRKRSARKKIDIEERAATITVIPAKDPSTGIISILCGSCRKMVPEQNIVVHQTRCRPAPRRTRTVEVLPSDSDSELSSAVKGAQLRSTNPYWSGTSTSIAVAPLEEVDMVQCPICMLDFPSERITIHANVCMDACLLK